MIDTMNSNVIDGIVLPPFVDQQGMDALAAFRLRPDDIFVASYPKSGTSWMQQIVKLIRNNGEDDGTKTDEAVPWLAANGKVGPPQDIDSMPSPRAFKVHMPFDKMPGGPPSNSPAKYIFLARNPKDTMVSTYHHYLAIKALGFTGTWDSLFKMFMDGQQYYGSWFDHVLEWWKHKDDPNVLFLKYEDLKMDLVSNVRRIADFLGYNLTPDVIHSIAEQTTFKNMKSTATANYLWLPPAIYTPNAVNPFVRKGEVGDWKSHFTMEQSAEFDAVYETKMKGTGLDFRFEL